MGSNVQFMHQMNSKWDVWLKKTLKNSSEIVVGWHGQAEKKNVLTSLQMWEVQASQGRPFYLAALV